VALSQETQETPGTPEIAGAEAERPAQASGRAKLIARLSKISRTEWMFFGLLVLCYVFFLEPVGTNTLSRYDMVWSLAHGTAIITPNTIDVSFYHGHYYSPRSLGLSLLAVPFLGLLHVLEVIVHHQPATTIQIAFLNMFTVVPIAIIATIVFYRLILRLRPSLAGTPVPFVVTTAFALGTLEYPFAVSFFSHAMGGCLMLCGFYLLYRARTAAHAQWLVALAGLLVGYAVITEYPTGVIMLALVAYLLVVFPGRRVRMLLIFALAMVPSALLLGWYDWFAFGNPFHLSYDSVAGKFSQGQHQGFFGVTLPSLDGLVQILLWPRGLLVESPFLVFVVVGFVRWWRSSARPSAELLLCLVISIIYPLIVSSYFLPMAGENLPGPRLLVPMLPFACLALAWVVDARSVVLRSVFAVLLVFGVAMSFFYVALGVREYHTYLTYPISSLILPVMATGYVPSRNGATPPNLATYFFHLPQLPSIYIVFVPLLAWAIYLGYALIRWQPTRANEARVER
jgi:hypothetical protein